MDFYEILELKPNASEQDIKDEDKNDRNGNRSFAIASVV
jgi:hypothetical protein